MRKKIYIIFYEYNFYLYCDCCYSFYSSKMKRSDCSVITEVVCYYYSFDAPFAPTTRS